MFTFKLPEISTTVDVRNIRRIRSGMSGVYVIRDEFGGYLYVGQSKTLRSRLLDHLRGSPFSAKISKVDLYYIDNGFDREICETIFIDRFAPQYNRAKVFEEFNEEQDRLLAEIERLEEHRISLREEKYELLDWLRGDSEELEDYYTDQDEFASFLLGEDLRCISRLREINHEIKRFSNAINDRYKLFRRISR